MKYMIIAAMMLTPTFQYAVAQDCRVETQAALSVKFSGTSELPETAVGLFDTRLEEVIVHSRSIGIMDLTPASRKYNIQPKSEGSYAYEADVAFEPVAPEKAMELMQVLAGRGFQSGVEFYSDCF